jgi:hypothetical protein
MHKRLWLWFLAGWLLSLAISPTAVMGMFKAGKKA